MHSNHAGHPSNAQPNAARSSFWSAANDWAMMAEQARRPLAIVTATARPGLLSQGSHVAPSPQRRIRCKRHETELTYCPVYGFKPRVICTKGLTPALFCGFCLLIICRHTLCCVCGSPRQRG